MVHIQSHLGNCVKNILGQPFREFVFLTNDAFLVFKLAIEKDHSDSWSTIQCMRTSNGSFDFIYFQLTRYY